MNASFYMSLITPSSTLTKIIAVFAMMLAPSWLQAANANEGKLYKAALVKTIQTSDRIVVTEHSDRSDFPINEVNRKDLPQFEYGKVALDERAKAKFLKNAEAMDSTNKRYFTVCIFVPHHTVRFYSGATLKSTMQICFHCGDIYWDASRLIPSDGLWTAILPLIKDAGFQTNAEPEYWAKRLKMAMEANDKK